MAFAPRDLGGGLLLRTARPADGEELVEFNAEMHGDDEHDAKALADWTRDLLDVPHPRFRFEEDTFVVEDTSTRRIVSATFLLPQEWSVAGVTMPVGQIELVATHPDYRRRGLIRTLFDAVHARSAELGELWQFVSGIPWYYRQFGYTYALDLPPYPVWWVHGTVEADTAWSIRPATAADAAFLARVEDHAHAGPSLACRHGVDGWAREVARRPGGIGASAVLVVELGRRDVEQPEPVGYLVHGTRPYADAFSLRACELLPGHDWLGAMRTVLDHLRSSVRADPDGAGKGVRFYLPEDHPARRAAATRLASRPGGGYGFYVRVPDICSFLDAIRPVLEERLATSPAAGHDGVLSIDLYTTQLRLTFQAGKLATIDEVPSSPDEADASLPAETLVHLLLGNRPLSELEATTADCDLRTDAGALLLDVLFPPLGLTPWEQG
jgi:GNAT superfamily N-acetyltransferase